MTTVGTWQTCPWSSSPDWASYEFLRRPVIDRTGLQGHYNFRWEIISTSPDPEQDNEGDTFPFFVQAMGLKLTRSTGPVETFVIDHVERPTSQLTPHTSNHSTNHADRVKSLHGLENPPHHRPPRSRPARGQGRQRHHHRPHHRPRPARHRHHPRQGALRRLRHRLHPRLPHLFGKLSAPARGRFEVVSHPEIFDGVRVQKGQAIAVIRANAATILSTERVILNLMQRMSGIATLTNEFVRAVTPTREIQSQAQIQTRILDTRKTIPGLRALDKYAVCCGGGINHRLDLQDGILIKNNHISLGGGLPAVLARALAGRKPGQIVQVEVRTQLELEQAIAGGADSILLDNMTPKEVAKPPSSSSATALPKATIEASGNMNLKTVARLRQNRRRLHLRRRPHPLRHRRRPQHAHHRHPIAEHEALIRLTCNGNLLIVGI